ncbi:MAG: quinone-dependent dihydroorotate dehydrogenase [Bacteroidales bacterium]|nr:quinone-dependent dihydroorotate dehydrogenase [Bacteroidales bacterium]
MYRYLIRPLLFFFSPENVHNAVLLVVKIAFKIPGIAIILRKYYHVSDPLLELEFLGMKFLNPVGLAAGFDKNAEAYNEFFNFGFSHIEVGTVTPWPQPGNPKPRSFRITDDKGLINRMGFNNHGVEALADALKKMRGKGLVIGGNIGKNTDTANADAVSDYEFCFRALYEYVDYFVVNVSCPNISNLHELQDQDGLEKILGRLSSIRNKQDHYIPILLKISPDLNNKQIDASLDIIRKYGIDGVVATNTTITREGLKTSDDLIHEIGNGGMSGEPLTSRSLEVVRYIHTKTNGEMPIIGVGGIMSAVDAMNMLNAGADLIQVYTGFIYNGPGFVRRINKALLKRYKS